MAKILLVFLLSGFCFGNSGAQATEKPILIGLIHFSPPLSNDMNFEPSLRHLQKVFAPRKVIAKVYSSAALEKAVEGGSVDFFYASSGFFYRMLPFGARDIATVVTDEKPMPNFGTAGAFITRRDRSDIKTFEDMKGKELTANYESAFHGYRIGMAELEKLGYNHRTFFKKTRFVGESAQKLLDEVISGKTDVAFIRACWLEEHELQNIAVLDKIKVIAARPGPIACLHSTSAYPNNTFAATYKVDPELARQVSVALLSMAPAKGGQHWSVATDFKPVDGLYRSLKVGPYAYLDQWSFKRIVKEYWPFIVIFFLAVFGLIVHSWRAQFLIDRTTRKLLSAEKSRQALAEKAQQLSEKMEAQQKVNLVGQLSSMFAHEMNQPLAACKYFIDGLKALRKNQSEMNGAILDYSIEKMDREIGRATQIVQKVREYSKQTDSREMPVDLSMILREICQTLSVKFSGHVHLIQAIAPDMIVSGDPVEVEILCWNLVKNAMEESRTVQGEVSVRLRCVASFDPKHPEEKTEAPSGAYEARSREADRIELTIVNDGRSLTDAQAQALGVKVFNTTKQDGLGLGLTVVNSIVEAMNGVIAFDANPSGGVTVTVAFIPFAPKELSEEQKTRPVQVNRQSI